MRARAHQHNIDVCVFSHFLLAVAVSAMGYLGNAINKHIFIIIIIYIFPNRFFCLLLFICNRNRVWRTRNIHIHSCNARYCHRFICASGAVPCCACLTVWQSLLLSLFEQTPTNGKYWKEWSVLYINITSVFVLFCAFLLRLCCSLQQQPSIPTNEKEKEKIWNRVI